MCPLQGVKLVFICDPPPKNLSEFFGGNSYYFAHTLSALHKRSTAISPGINLQMVFPSWKALEGLERPYKAEPAGKWPIQAPFRPEQTQPRKDWRKCVKKLPFFPLFFTFSPQFWSVKTVDAQKKVRPPVKLLLGPNQKLLQVVAATPKQIWDRRVLLLLRKLVAPKNIAHILRPLILVPAQRTFHGKSSDVPSPPAARGSSGWCSTAPLQTTKVSQDTSRTLFVFARVKWDHPGWRLHLSTSLSQPDKSENCSCVTTPNTQGHKKVDTLYKGALISFRLVSGTQFSAGSCFRTSLHLPRPRDVLT